MSTSYNYIISNNENIMLRFKLNLFGVESTLPAIFQDEDAALMVLFAMQAEGVVSSDYKIIRVSSQFSVDVIPYGADLNNN